MRKTVELQQEYTTIDHGLQIMEIEGVSVCRKPELAPVVEKLFKGKSYTYRRRL